MCWFPGAAVTKDHRLGASRAENYYPTALEAQKSKIKVYTESTALEGSLLASLSVSTGSFHSVCLGPNFFF